MASMRNRLWTISLVLAVFVCKLPVAQGGKLRKVSEVDIRRLVHATNGMPEFPVFALRFSPDGRKLAVIADIYETHDGRRSRLLVVDVDHPSADVQQFEIEFGILENENGRGGVLNFGWTQSGEIVYAAGKVIHVRDGKTCELPNDSVFISNDVAISARRVPPAGDFSSTHLKFYSGNCVERETWEVSEDWIITDVSVDRHLLSIRGFTAPYPSAESLIVDPLERKVLQRWSGKDLGAWMFADSGKAVCMGGDVLESNHAPATCRNVDTGNLIGETVGNGAEPIATAAHASRVVVSDYRRRRIPFFNEYDATFHGRVLWDFGTGKELATWSPESETYPNVFKPGKQITEPFRFTISPNGEYIAEGGNGKLSLYQVEP